MAIGTIFTIITYQRPYPKTKNKNKQRNNNIDIEEVKHETILNESTSNYILGV